ncbi:MAG: glycosyltransferase, partial [Clostridia bacterium]|nr:glycosyltransferase [Clostridia bacterium]
MSIQLTFQKVLIATMSLELGGAETHIVELCLKLRRRGLEVVVVSAGGVLVQRLEEAGVRHLVAPLDSRSPSSMRKAYRELSRALDEERPDIVHAHARIPAFLLNSLCKRRRIPFVTTTHGSYSTSLSLRLLTRWGSKTLAVSNDIRDFLTENYKVAERDIFVTVNGIDTEAFCRDEAAGAMVRRELKLSPDDRVLLSVSRLDPDADGGVFRLLKEAPMLREAVAGLRIVIVGGGADFAAVEAEAEQLNREAGEPYLLLTGPRSDIPRLLNACDVFYGISRAALEAAACERPVVLGGTAGWLGLLSEETEAAAKENNLTCRGHAWPEEPCLAAVVAPLMTGDEAARLGVYGRALVLRDYSAERMAEDALRCYRAAQLADKRTHYDFLLAGYYGYDNAGDELLLTTIVENLLERCPGAALCVLNHSTEAASCRPEVALAQRFSPFQVLGALRRSRVLLFGGGSLLQDVTSVKSLTYYLGLLRLAKWCGCKTMLYG